RRCGWGVRRRQSRHRLRHLGCCGAPGHRRDVGGHRLRRANRHCALSRRRDPGASARPLARGARMKGSLVVSVLVAWELAVRLLAVPDYLLPPPSAIATELVARFALVAPHGAVTLGEIAVGLVAAVGGGVVLALGMAAVPFLHRGLYPLLAFLQAVPKV